MRGVIAAIIAVAVTACACSSVTFGVGSRVPGGFPSTTSAQQSIPSGASSPSLSSQLLQLSDLPGGWQPDYLPGFTDATTPPCLRVPFRIFESTVVAFASSVPNESAVIGEGLAQLKSASGAQAILVTTVSLVDRCKSFHPQKPDGTASPVNATLTREPLPAVGDQSAAWRLEIGAGLNPDQPTVTGSGELLIARRGAELVLLEFIQLGNHALVAILPFARIAIAKMPR